MRPEDLIPAFISELEDLQNNYIVEPGTEEQAKSRCTRTTNLLADIESRINGADYYESEECHYDLEALFDQLNEWAGPGLSFGSHEGDGSDYGFWPCYQDDDDDQDDDDQDDDDQDKPGVTCDSCAWARINGVFCHETGCPNAGRTWDQDREAWIKYVPCWSCGDDVEVGETCDCNECNESDD
jgi:hypothetical protein